jgi:membrane-associated phospholipid phosphatase
MVAVGIGAAIYLACAAVAGRGSVPEPEREAFHAINGLPDWLWAVAFPVQLLGVLVVPLVLAPVAAILGRWRLAAALAAIPVLKYVLEYGVIKRTIHRARPFTSVCQQDPTCAEFRNVPLVGPSFVSGHAIIAAATAVVLLPYLARPWGRVAVVLLALGVAASRIYLGAHNPLDVVGGLAVGTVLGSALNLALGVPRGGGRR